MRSLRTILIVAASLAGRAGAQAPTQPCDAWERALPVAAGSEWFTMGATQTGTSPCDVGVSLDTWLVYTPERAGEFGALIYGIHGFDPVASLFTLDAGELVLLDCNDDTLVFPGESWARVDWTAQATHPYFLRVSGKNGATGRFAAYFGPDSGPSVDAVRPVNGTRDRPLPIRPGFYQAYTRTGPGENGPCFLFSESVWYSYTPIQSGVITVITCSSGLLTPSGTDASISVEANGSNVSCGFCDPPTGTSFQAQAGTEYLIRVGPSNGSAGSFSMQVFGAPTAGDTCADAETIGEGFHLLTLEGATPSGSSACSFADPDHFFRYVAPASGTLSVSTCTTSTAAIGGYGVDAALSLHSGCPADLSTELACSKTSVLCVESLRPQPWLSTQVTQGQEILIRVSARAEGQLGPIELEVQLEPHLASCFGDGSATPCPCGNVGAPQRGCDNSFGTGGAKLEATGRAALFGGSLTLVTSGGPRTAPMLLLQGLSARNNGQGTPFSDGLLCVEGDMRRLIGALPGDGSAVFGEQAGQDLAELGGVQLPGTRWYQGFYRNVPAYCTGAPANLTNAVRITWDLFP